MPSPNTEESSLNMETTPDKVVKSRFWDSNDVLQKVVMEFTYRFDDVLDAEKLKSSLERLLEIGDWRNLGARFKKNATGGLEFHIPPRYDEKRPGFVWSHERLKQNIRDHPLASKMPQASDLKRPTLFPSSEEFHDLVTRPGHASTFSDWTDTDQPALSVHVVSFDDATLLTISWSHVFLDALGRQSLLQAWTSVLDGREEDVPAFIPFHVDPAHEIARGGDPKKHILYNCVLTGIWFAMFVVGYMYELFVHSAEASRMICLPGHWVEALRQQAMADVLPSGHSKEDVFLSHGDVILAWWAKVSVAAQRLGSSRPVNITNVTNVRGLFPELLPDNGVEVYTTNAAIMTNTLITCGRLTNLSVGALALRLRQDLQQQRNPEQARHFVAWQLESRKRYRRPPVLGSWNQIMLSWSSWHRARFYDFDFSAAVVRPGLPLEQRSNKLGRPSFILPNGHTNGLNLRNVGPLIGQDANGNWWMQTVLREGAWAQVKEQFNRL